MHLGKKSEEYSTHRWKLYIRGPNNEDLSCFVQKVAFTLHPSFAEPIRGTFGSSCSFILFCSLCEHFLQLSQNTEVKKAPFEVSETGWGEFEASIRIFFKDPEERPLDLFHLIKLYPPGPPQLSGSLKKVCAIYLYWVFLLRCALTFITLCSPRQWLRSSTTRSSSASPRSPFWSS